MARHPHETALLRFWRETNEALDHKSLWSDACKQKNLF
jgi:hypothetical protein